MESTYRTWRHDIAWLEVLALLVVTRLELEVKIAPLIGEDTSNGKRQGEANTQADTNNLQILVSCKQPKGSGVYGGCTIWRMYDTTYNTAQQVLCGLHRLFAPLQ
jgi:hypothetical protein